MLRSEPKSRNHGASEGVIMICEIRLKVNFQVGARNASRTLGREPTLTPRLR